MPLRNLLTDINRLAGTAYLVGGAVRDLFLLENTTSLNVALWDLDIEVHGLGFDVLQNLLQEFSYTIFVGKQFGVLKMPQLGVDWSLPRIDSVGRKPKVFFDKNLSIKDALSRRDVTINAIALDLTALVQDFDNIIELARVKGIAFLVTNGFLKVQDPFGGILDIKNRILRPVDNKKFIEDPLRFFRVMQFLARFEFLSSCEMDNVARLMKLDLVNPHSDYYIARERITEEVKKMFLKATKPSLGFCWVQELGRLAELFPMFSDLAQNSTEWDKFLEALDTSKILSLEHNFTEQQTLTLIFAVVFFCLKDDSQRKLTMQNWLFDNKIFSDALKINNIFQHNGHVDGISTIDLKLLAKLLEPIPLYFYLTYLLSLGLIDRVTFKIYYDNAYTAHVLFKAEPPLVVGKDLLPYFGQTPILGKYLKMAYNLQIVHGCVSKEQVLVMLRLDYNVK